MNRLTHTGIYVAGAVVLGAVAWLSSPSPPQLDQFRDQGQPFYADFTDPLAAVSLEVIDYEGASGTARPFKVELRDGRWSIPSHYGYPADGEDRLARTAAAVMDLRKDIVQSDRKQDHEVLGLIDPLDETTPSLQGRGQRVTLRETSGRILADFIFGREVEEKEGFRYARIPDKKRSYAVKVDIDLSTRFEDWIDTNLLEVTAADVTEIEINDYSIDETTGRVDQAGTVYLARPDGDAWTLESTPEGSELDESAVDTMVGALPEIAITGVRPKPGSLTSDLRTREGLNLDPVTQLSLQDKGFFISRDGRLLSNEGEVQVGTNAGVRYTLRFGEVFYGDGLAVSAGADEGGDADETAGSENRYLFVTALFDESLLPPRPTPPADYTPTPDEETETSAARPGDAVALGAFQEQADPPADAEETTTGDEEPGEGETDAPAPSAEDEERRLAAEAYERDLAAWEENAEAGAATAQRLNDRFAEWYYVISGDDFRKIRLDLEKLTKPIEEEAATEGD